MPGKAGHVHACPQCGNAVERAHRHLRDRVANLVLRVHRYRCSNPDCGWEGVVSIPPPPPTPHARPKWLAKLAVGWPARLVWMCVGAVCAILPLEGSRYLIERERLRAEIAEADPGPELLAPLPGQNFDGIVMTSVVSPTPNDQTPLERRNACMWGVPGRNPYRGSVSQVLHGANLPPEVVRRIENAVERGRVNHRVEISNRVIQTIDGKRRFDTKVPAMGFGKTLCFNTRVNFPNDHVEMADLYETTDNNGVTYSVMVPYVCGNVAVLAERAERPPEYRTVPEPGTLASLAAAFAAMMWVMRRRRDCRGMRHAEDNMGIVH